MICKAYNAHIRKLIDQQNILWKCILSDGTEVWSDFNSPEYEKDPWTRLKIYCANNNLNINKVIVLAIGAREETVFEDENGLDGIFIVRGMSRDLMVDSSIEYKFVSFGLLNKDTDTILVKKYFWPECAFEKNIEERLLTLDNEKLMFFKKKMCGDNCKCQSIEQI